MASRTRTRTHTRHSRCFRFPRSARSLSSFQLATNLSCFRHILHPLPRHNSDLSCSRTRKFVHSSVLLVTGHPLWISSVSCFPPDFLKYLAGEHSDFGEFGFFSLPFFSQVLNHVSFPPVQMSFYYGAGQIFGVSTTITERSLAARFGRRVWQDGIWGATANGL
jgi:hypothetical protein